MAFPSSRSSGSVAALRFRSESAQTLAVILWSHGFILAPNESCPDCGRSARRTLGQGLLPPGDRRTRDSRGCRRFPGVGLGDRRRPGFLLIAPAAASSGCNTILLLGSAAQVVILSHNILRGQGKNLQPFSIPHFAPYRSLQVAKPLDASRGMERTSETPGIMRPSLTYPLSSSCNFALVPKRHVPVGMSHINFIIIRLLISIGLMKPGVVSCW